MPEGAPGNRMRLPRGHTLAKTRTAEFIYGSLSSTAHTAASESVIRILPDVSVENRGNQTGQTQHAMFGCHPTKGPDLPDRFPPCRIPTHLLESGRIEICGAREGDFDEL